MSSSATSITFLQGSQTCFFFLDKPTELGFMHTCAWYTLQSKRPNIWGLDKQGPSKTISSSVPNAQQNSVNTQTVIKLMLHTQDMGVGGSMYNITVLFPLSHYSTKKLERSLGTLIVFILATYTKVAAASQDYRQGIALLSMSHISCHVLSYITEC